MEVNGEVNGEALDDLARRVDAACRLTGSFRLRSGQTSDTYFDKYALEADPGLLREVARSIVPLVPEDLDALAGLELGGVPLATMLSQMTGVPARFVRKRPKEYGTERLAEGGPVDGLALAVVEDVVTTGGAVLAAVEELRARGARVDVVLCVIDREQGGGEAFARQGLELRPLLTRTALERARR